MISSTKWLNNRPSVPFNMPVAHEESMRKIGLSENHKLIASDFSE